MIGTILSPIILKKGRPVYCRDGTSIEHTNGSQCSEKKGIKKKKKREKEKGKRKRKKSEKTKNENTKEKRD